MQDEMIVWPAVIRHHEAAELIYIEDESGWNNDESAHACVYDEVDMLIDSTGQIFSLDTCKNARVIPVKRHKTIPLLEFLGLVKAHVAQTGACCVAKLYAPNLCEAFKVVASTQEH